MRIAAVVVLSALAAGCGAERPLTAGEMDRLIQSSRALTDRIVALTAAVLSEELLREIRAQNR